MRAGECAALFLVLVRAGLDPSSHILIIAAFASAASSLVGVRSMLPAGLGVADDSVAGMLLLLLPGDDMTRGTAPAATLLIRFATLWIDVILRVMSLALRERGTTTGQVRTRSSESA